MFVALILAQVGVALSRKEKTDLAKYRGAAMLFGKQAIDHADLRKRAAAVDI